MTEIDPLPSTAPNVQNGTFTVDSPKGRHWTVKLHTAQHGDLAGKRILSMLIGPDNTTDFVGVAFWNDENRTAVVFKKSRGANSDGYLDGYSWRGRGTTVGSPVWSETEEKLAIWSDLAIRGDGGFWGTAGYKLLLEGRCVRCNRPLTDPVSIELGIGPVCRGDAA